MPTGKTTARQGRVKPRDVIWDELERLFGPVTNAASRGRRNRCVKLIKESILALAGTERWPRNDEQVLAEIRGRHRQLTILWPGPKPTDIWLASRWDDCDPTLSRRPVASPQQRLQEEGPVASRETALSYLNDWRSRNG